MRKGGGEILRGESEGEREKGGKGFDASSVLTSSSGSLSGSAGEDVSTIYSLKLSDLIRVNFPLGNPSFVPSNDRRMRLNAERRRRETRARGGQLGGEEGN